MTARERWFSTIWFVIAAGCGGRSIREDAGAGAATFGSTPGAGADVTGKGGAASMSLGGSTGGDSPTTGADGLPHPTTSAAVFDPGEVYVWGSLDVGICGRDALTTWWDPEQVQTGFACQTSSSPHASVIDPQSDQLVYAQFHADVDGGIWQLASFTPDGDGTHSYPTAPAANDPILAASCSGDLTFWADPSGRGTLFHCGRDCAGFPCRYVWQSGEELSLPLSCKLLHLGFDGRVLVHCQSGLAIQDADGNLTQLDEPSYLFYIGDPGAVRATPQGFWMLFKRNAQLERYSAGFDGSMTDDGVYPLPSLADFTLENCALDAMGSAYCLVTLLAADGPYQIVRTEVGASSFTVVYDENANPPVKLPGYGLFTGP